MAKLQKKILKGVYSLYTFVNTEESELKWLISGDIILDSQKKSDITWDLLPAMPAVRSVGSFDQTKEKKYTS